MCIMDNPHLIVKFNNFGPTLFKLGMFVVIKAQLISQICVYKSRT